MPPLACVTGPVYWVIACAVTVGEECEMWHRVRPGAMLEKCVCWGCFLFCVGMFVYVNGRDCIVAGRARYGRVE